MLETDDVVSSEMLQFQMHCIQKMPFFAIKFEELLHCKNSSHLLAKNISSFDFMCTRRLSKSLTDDIMKRVML